MMPYLTDDEIAEICAPLVNPSAQVRYLQRLGLLVNRKPNGKPLVARKEFERVLVGRSDDVVKNSGTGTPNRQALINLLGRQKYGQTA